MRLTDKDTNDKKQREKNTVNFFPFLISIVVFGKVDRQRIKTA